MWCVVSYEGVVPTMTPPESAGHDWGDRLTTRWGNGTLYGGPRAIQLGKRPTTGSVGAPIGPVASNRAFPEVEAAGTYMVEGQGRISLTRV